MLAIRWLNQKYWYICFIIMHVPHSLRQAFRELFVKDKAGIISQMPLL